MHGFLESIKRVQEGTSRDFFERLFELFLKINSFTRDEAIAAYEAFEFFRGHVRTPADVEKHGKLLDKIRAALVTRMCILCCNEPAEVRAHFARVFSRLTSDYYHFQEFLREEKTKKGLVVSS